MLRRSLIPLISALTFAAGYTSSVSFGELIVRFDIGKPAYARPGLVRMSRGVLKFLSLEIAKGVVSVGVESILTPKSQATEPSPNRVNRQYTGSFFQCSLGCKYYWS